MNPRSRSLSTGQRIASSVACLLPILLLMIAFSSSGCSESDSNPSSPLVVEGVSRITMSPSSVSFGAAGETRQFTATAFDADDDEIEGQAFAWSCSNTDVATVSSSGLVTAVGTGNAVVTAAADGKSANAAVGVNAPTLERIEVSPTSLALSSAGAKGQLTATAFDSNDDAMTGLSFTWTSANSGVPRCPRPVKSRPWRTEAPISPRPWVA